MTQENVIVQEKEEVKLPEKFHSDEIGKIAEALSKAQGLIGNAHKDSSNPFFKSSYADLASCWDACREALAKNNLAVVQTHRKTPRGKLLLITQLIHSSGQWIKGDIVMDLSKADPQGYGSATTYARRYGLCAMVGISPADDDGNSCSGKKVEKKAKVVRKKTDNSTSKQNEDEDEF